MSEISERIRWFRFTSGGEFVLYEREYNSKPMQLAESMFYPQEMIDEYQVRNQQGLDEIKTRNLAKSSPRVITKRDFAS